MPTPILATKLYLPRLRPNVVSRPPPARAAERGSAPQADPHRCPRWLWENYTGQRMGGWLRPAGGLAVAGRRGERPDTLSDVPGRCFTDDCAYHWGRGVGCAP